MRFPLGSEGELVIDSASTRTVRYQGVDFWVAVGYLDKVGSVSGPTGDRRRAEYFKK